MAALLAFYVLQIGLDALWGNTCSHLAIDYCAFWSAGRVANENGYAGIYNLQLLRQVQLPLIANLSLRSAFAVSPIAYLPIFIIPFQLLASIPPSLGYWIWTAINLVGLLAYLKFFIRNTTGHPMENRILFLIVLSLPVYWNLLNGQVNTWLVISVGEFLRAIFSNRPLRAGLWLGGLWLKPQTLILIGLILLLRRAGRILLGFSMASVVLTGVSLLMIGIGGFQQLIRLWLGFTSGLPTNDVEIMMNWRMVGMHLSSFLVPGVGWTIAGVGLLITSAAVLYLWRRSIPPQSPAFAAATLGTLAATGAVAWHSHVHMAMFLLPPMIYLIQQKGFSPKILNIWVFLPAGGYILAFLLAALVETAPMLSSLNPWLNFLRGAGEFSLNLYLVVWAINQIRSDRSLQSR